MDHEERLEKRQEEEKARIAKKEAEAKQLIEERVSPHGCLGVRD